MANLKLAYWPKPEVVLVADETKTLTIEYFPKRRLVLIVATTAGGAIKDLIINNGLIPFVR